MSQYEEYQGKADEHGRRKPGPGGDQGSGQTSGCMVIAAVAATVVALSVIARRR